MRKLALCFAVLLFFAVSGVAQGDMGQSSSSDQSTTSTTKSKKAKSSTAAGGEHQVTGCLAGPRKASGTAENEKTEKHLKVSSIKHIADSCSAPTAKKGKKSKAAAAPTT